MKILTNIYIETFINTLSKDGHEVTYCSDYLAQIPILNNYELIVLDPKHDLAFVGACFALQKKVTIIGDDTIENNLLVTRYECKEGFLKDFIKEKEDPRDIVIRALAYVLHEDYDHTNLVVSYKCINKFHKKHKVNINMLDKEIDIEIEEKE